MQYTITISQLKALEWGLNAQQALLFAFVYECPSWARPIRTEHGIFYALSKAKIIEELPLLTGKPDTAYRLLKQLAAASLIELSHTPAITLVRLTDKGREWNRKADGSEKYPSDIGNKSEVGRKNIRGGSEKYPTNQDTSNQDTNQDTNQGLGASAPPAISGTQKSPQIDEQFEAAWKAYPKREGANPKNKALSSWNARRKEGVSTEDMMQGVIRYAAYCTVKGSIGTEYVMQAQRFFGRGREYENDWTATAAPASVGLAKHNGFAQRDYTSGLTPREDGTYAF